MNRSFGNFISSQRMKKGKIVKTHGLSWTFLVTSEKNCGKLIKPLIIRIGTNCLDFSLVL